MKDDIQNYLLLSGFIGHPVVVDRLFIYTQIKLGVDTI